MRALVVDGGNVKFDPARPEPAPRAGEIVVDVLLAGVCATDLEIARGYMQFSGVLGHEFVGIARSGKFANKRVVGEINAGCGACPRCAAGGERHCPNRSVLGILGRDGAFAQSLTLPECNLLEVPDSISNEKAVFTEPLAAAFAIEEQIAITNNMPVCVLGDGRLGILCALALASRGARVVHIGKNDSKLAVTAARGIRTVKFTNREALRAQSLQFPVVVEATGAPSGLDTALDLVEPRGKILLKTTVNDPPSHSLARIVIHEITIIGSRCGKFAPALAALANGSMDPSPLIHGRYPLDRGIEAFERAAKPGILKILLEA